MAAARTLDELIERGASGATAVTVPGGPGLTYAQLRNEVASAAEGLAHLGLHRGHRIATVLPNSAETIVMFLAAARVGTAAPLNPTYKEEEFRFYLEDIAAAALVVPPGGAELARKALPAGATLVEAGIDEIGHIRVDGAAQRPQVGVTPSPDPDTSRWCCTQ